MFTPSRRLSAAVLIVPPKPVISDMTDDFAVANGDLSLVEMSLTLFPKSVVLLTMADSSGETSGPVPNNTSKKSRMVSRILLVFFPRSRVALIVTVAVAEPRAWSRYEVSISSPRKALEISEKLPAIFSWMLSNPSRMPSQSILPIASLKNSVSAPVTAAAEPATKVIALTIPLPILSPREAQSVLARPSMAHLPKSDMALPMDLPASTTISLRPTRTAPTVSVPALKVELILDQIPDQSSVRKYPLTSRRRDLTLVAKSLTGAQERFFIPPMMELPIPMTELPIPDPILFTSAKDGRLKPPENRVVNAVQLTSLRPEAILPMDSRTLSKILATESNIRRLGRFNPSKSLPIEKFRTTDLMRLKPLVKKSKNLSRVFVRRLSNTFEK